MLDRYDQNLLLDYLEGQLDPDRRAQLEAQLADDPQLAALLEAMASDRDALRALPRADVPADLALDLTQSLERRMLLDELPADTGPIPLSRGRTLPGEPAGGMRWGRIAGLSALAASVALAAGIVVITLGDDPLTQTANELASASGAEDESNSEPSGAARPGARDVPGTLETDGSPLRQPGLARPPESLAAGQPGFEIEADQPDQALALADLADTNAAARSVDPRRAQPEASAVPPSISDPLDPRERVALVPKPMPAAEPAVALALAQPSRQVVVYTDQPEQAREQLVAFCISNGIAIVQADRQMQYGALRHASDPQDGPAPEPTQPLAGTATDDASADPESITTPPGRIVNEQAPADRAPANADYALLISEAQLDALIAGINKAPRGFVETIGPGGLFVNQAAVLTQPADKFAPQAGVPTEPGGRVDGEKGGVPKAAATAHPRVDERNQPGQQADTQSPHNAAQTIVLRLPADLGSPYANTLNRQNLYAKQSVGAQDARTPTAAAQQADSAAHNFSADSEIDAAGAAQEADVLRDDEPAPGREQAQSTESNPAPETERAPGAKAEPDSRTTKDDTSKVSPLDAVRSNWLSPYLPPAQTTPILRWRDQSPQARPQLVPILIQPAPAERVNAVRLQAQIKPDSKPAPARAGDAPNDDPPAEAAE